MKLRSSRSMLLIAPPYIEGIIYSLFFLLALGPAFFYLISLAINEGLKPALFFAIGIIFSDIVITSAVYFGLGDLFETDLFQEIFSLVGSILIAFYGIKFIMQKKAKIDTNTEVKHTTLVGNLIKGFLMNVLNPFAFIIWVTLMAKLKLTHPNYGHDDFLQFFIGFFSVLLLVEFSKALLAHKIRTFLTENIVLIVNKILGIIFLGVAIWLLYNFISIFFQI